jgi:hypothetical protein
MQAYTGQTRSGQLLRRLTALGIGECVCRGELGDKTAIPPRRIPWFYDNGAYRDYTARRAFDEYRWVRDQWKINGPLKDRGFNPDFVVVPDILGGGAASLLFSASHRADVADEVPAYLALQDGMTWRAVERHLADLSEQGLPYTGLFVGGKDDWKRDEGGFWVQWGHERGMKVHLARVGTPAKVKWAREIGPDSIDSSLPLWTHDGLDEFIKALGL